MWIEKKPKLDKHVDKDVVLCKTTNKVVGKRIAKVLLEDSIPFTANWKHIPFYLQESYEGATQLCIIHINRNLYSKARKSIAQMDQGDKRRVLLNVI